MMHPRKERCVHDEFGREIQVNLASIVIYIHRKAGN
jgi:hypothetical protein